MVFRTRSATPEKKAPEKKGEKSADEKKRAKKEAAAAAPPPPPASPLMQRLSAERIERAKKRIDWRQPGALDEFALLKANADASPEAYEELANKYPVKFDRRYQPAPSERANVLLDKLQQMHANKSVAIRSGKEVGHETTGALNTGNMYLNYALNGGARRGYMSEWIGMPSSAKTTTLLQMAAETQRAGGRVAWIAVERLDKSWARHCGVIALFRKDEIEQFDADAREYAEAYNAVHAEAGSRFTVVVGYSGNEVLQVVVDLVRTNVYDLIVVDSILELRRISFLNQEKVDPSKRKTVGDENPGGEAKLYNDFCSRVQGEFNFVEANVGRALDRVYMCQCGHMTKIAKDKHKKCPDGTKAVYSETKTVGEPVRSHVAVVNQLRDRGIGSGNPLPPSEGGGWGLKFLKAQELHFSASETLSTTINGYPAPYAGIFTARCTKSKVGGAAHRTAVFMIHIADVPGVCKKGTYDVVTDLIGCSITKGETTVKYPGLAELAGLIRQSGAYYYLGDQSFQGYERLRAYLVDPENSHVVDAMRLMVNEWIIKQSEGV